MKKQIICINWGRKYGPRYINRLYAGVARNLTGAFSFTCFCDNPEGIRPEVRTEPLPELDVEMPKATQGIWPKARLWSARLGDLEGPVLFMDLDMVVVGPLDGFFDEGADEDVILARNENTPFEKLGQTSIFRFPVGKLLPLQEKFRADPQGVAVRDAIRHHGLPGANAARVGKMIELDLADSTTEAQLHEVCRDLLSNPVVEDYEVVIES